MAVAIDSFPESIYQTTGDVGVRYSHQLTTKNDSNFTL